MKKTFILKPGNIEELLTTSICLGTNDESQYPKDEHGKPFVLCAHFTHESETGDFVFITENPVEIELLTTYLKRTVNPFFYDADNPSNDPLFYKTPLN